MKTKSALLLATATVTATIASSGAVLAFNFDGITNILERYMPEGASQWIEIAQEVRSYWELAQDGGVNAVIGVLLGEAAQLCEEGDLGSSDFCTEWGENGQMVADILGEVGADFSIPVPSEARSQTLYQIDGTRNGYFSNRSIHRELATYGINGAIVQGGAESVLSRPGQAILKSQVETAASAAEAGSEMSAAAGEASSTQDVVKILATQTGLNTQLLSQLAASQPEDRVAQAMQNLVLSDISKQQAREHSREQVQNSLSADEATAAMIQSLSLF